MRLFGFAASSAAFDSLLGWQGRPGVQLTGRGPARTFGRCWSDAAVKKAAASEQRKLLAGLRHC